MSSVFQNKSRKTIEIKFVLYRIWNVSIYLLIQMVGVIFFSGSDLMFLKDPSKNDFSVNGKTKSRIKIKTEQHKRIEKMIK